MSCAVYCLVSHPEELDPLVQRIRDAGIATADIAIVPRRRLRESAVEAAGPPPSTFADSSCFAPSFWNLSLSPAALWWQWALQCQSLIAAQSEEKRTAIPLAQYEARVRKIGR